MNRYQKTIKPDREKAFTKGLCIDCWQKKDKSCISKYRCLTCAEKNNQKMKTIFEQRNRNNQCWMCGNKAIIKNLINFFQGKERKWKICVKCFFKEASKKHLGTQKEWGRLKSLLEKQNYKCYLSGRNLQIGKNASIDHIKSRSKGGRDKIKNLAWCDTQINLVKNRLSKVEFINLCKEITQRNEYKK